MHLNQLWFILIAVLWGSYFVLEGFDFGVGILLPVIGRDELRKRILINTIGPVWDGNEVWLITAGGAMFAAFPEWYAAMFSAFYLPLLIILVALIIRGVAFEYRGKRTGARWKRRWDICIFLGSLLPAVLWGVAFGNVLRGIKLSAAHQYTGNFLDFLNPYALLGGLATLTLFTLHGAVFLSLKTSGSVSSQARRAALSAGPAALVAGGGFLAWTGLSHRTPGATAAWSVVLAAVAALCLACGLLACLARRDGWAFTGTALGIGATTASLFLALYHNVLPSLLSPSYSLTVSNASSTAKTLMVMTVVACVFLPFVLLYQGWSYWVFRKRLGAPVR